MENNKYQHYLQIGLEAAKVAGELQVEGLSRTLEIQTKATPIDLVTEVDKQCEAEIARIILTNFPDHRLLAEEGTIGGTDPDYCWIIDPLDGTTNFTHHYPHFCVSIALEYKGEIVVGVVYDAIHNELFSAASGEGAFLNEQRITVSNVSNMAQSLLCTGFPGDRAGNQQVLAEWEKISLHCHGIRRDGSAALDLCYVACGRFDGFWEQLNAWDMAAGALIVQEAGGTVTNFKGERFDQHKREIIASNGPVGQEMVQWLSNR